MRDLHLLPKVRDSLSFLYVEHVRIEQEDKAIALWDARGKTPVPCASLTTLMLGPGTTITHAAVKTLAESGCLLLWTGEAGVRLYAQGLGETRSSRLLQKQVRLWADAAAHERVVRRMYEMRFGEPVDPGMTLQQIRGREGLRVRQIYSRLSEATGVAWSGRSYDRSAWGKADAINRALSAANACLYGVCHSAILSVGCSPALGFIHTGRLLSFVYDLADLYKTQISIPAAFAVVAQGEDHVERRARQLVRDSVYQDQLLKRIVPDLQRLFEAEDVDAGTLLVEEGDADSDLMPPGELWDPRGSLDGGVNWADEQDGG